MPPNGCTTYTTGTPRLGKMSAGARRSERPAPARIAKTRTRIVMGRRSAMRTSHMSRPSGSRLQEERAEVPRGAREKEQRAADLEPRHRVVDLRLREEALGVSEVDHGREARLETRRCLLLGGTRRGQGGGRLLGALERAAQHGGRRRELARHGEVSLVPTSDRDAVHGSRRAGARANGR